MGGPNLEPKSQRSSTWLKSGYGTAEIGLTSMEVMLQVYLLELYVSVGLNPVWAGGALAIAVAWDALSDPLMGLISDKTPASTARGKRISFFVLGIPLSAFAFTQLFSPSLGATDVEMFAHLLLWSVLLNTAMTLVAVPYLSLINDLASGSQERTGFMGWRTFFSAAGLIAGLSIPAILSHNAQVEITPTNVGALASNRSESSGWIALTLVLFSVVAILAVWRSAGGAVSKIENRSGFLESLRTALKSRAFRFLVFGFVFIAAGRAVNASLALIFYKGTLQFSDSQVAAALIGLSLTVMVATPIWVLAARRWSKEKLVIAGSVGLTLLTAIAYPLMPPGALGPVVFVVVAGGFTASSVVLLEALFSDVIEADGTSSGLSLTGSYYGLWRMATKIARAVGLLVSGIFLGMIGFVEGETLQTPGVYRSVAWAFGPGVALFFGVGSWLLWKGFFNRRTVYG